MQPDTPENDAAGKKVGVYICHCGGNISDHVDVQQLARNVETIDGVSVTHTNMFMCSDPGQELIQEDVYDLVRIFYDVLCGQPRYARQPAAVKDLCMGLKKSLIRKRFRNAGQLRRYIETLEWE